MSDLISREELLHAIDEKYSPVVLSPSESVIVSWVYEMIQAFPSAEPEQPPEIQDILNYLDTVLHPIISPEYWDVYAELHDMISTLPSAEPKHGKWIFQRNYTWACSECGANPTKGMGYVQCKEELFKYCPNCGADMREGE